MTETEDSPAARLRRKVEAIVEKGVAVREKVHGAFLEAARGALGGWRELQTLSTEALQGAVAAMEKATPKDPDNVLRQVIQGLGDGLATTAMATALAVKEAAGRGNPFAGEDLKQASKDLKESGKHFVACVSQVVGDAKGRVAGMLGDAREHAQRTFESIRPSLEGAVKAAADDPKGLAREAASAGAVASRQAAGSLLSAFGNFLNRAAEQVKGEKK